MRAAVSPSVRCSRRKTASPRRPCKATSSPQSALLAGSSARVALAPFNSRRGLSSKGMNTPEYKLLAGRPQPEHAMQAANLPLIAEDEASPEVAKLYAHFRSRFGRSHVP